MTHEELITKQQIEIEEKKQFISNAIESARNIYMMAYGVGGPLNDNILGFSKEQRVFINRMVLQIEDIIPEEN